MSRILDFWINVAAGIFVTLLYAFIAFIIYLWYLRDRREMLSFFGINPDHPKICIYLSTLQVQAGGTRGIEEIQRGYIGPAITKIEHDGALILQTELKLKHLASLPRNIQDWLGHKIVELRTLDVPILLSPTEGDFRKEEYLNDNMIILGSSIYNSLSHYYLYEYFPRYFGEHHDYYKRYFFYGRDANGQRVIFFREWGRTDSILEGRDKGAEPAFIQRIRDCDSGATVFICGGLGSAATFGSIRYLSENWRKLQQQFKDKEFGIGLVFRSQDADVEEEGSVKQPVLISPVLLRED